MYRGGMQTMEPIKELIRIQEELEEIVSSQIQVRTNKLKPLIEEMRGIVTDPKTKIMPDNVQEELEDLSKDNKYLKRKLTMYELKISKLEKENSILSKENKKLKKENKKQS